MTLTDTPTGIIIQESPNVNGSIIIKNDNTIWSSGYNYFTNTNDNNYTFTQITNPSNSTPISIYCAENYTRFDNNDENYMIILMEDGSIWGRGNLFNTNTLSKIDNPSNSTPKSIYCISFYIIVLMEDGTLWGRGVIPDDVLYWLPDMWNDFMVDFYNFTQITNPSNSMPYSISCGEAHIIILMEDGTIWGYGFDTYGELGGGQNTIFYYSVLTKITNPSTSIPKTISCIGKNTIILMEDGTLWGCGHNEYRQLGLGHNNGFVRVFTKMINPSNSTPDSIYTSQAVTIVVMKDGTIWSCGYNYYGQLGLGHTNQDTVNTLTNMINPSNSTPKKIYCSFVTILILMQDDTIWGCGRNEYGQLGSGHVNDVNTLTNMNYLSNSKPDFIYFSGDNTIILMKDGTLWGCGKNDYGQLGLGNTNNVSTLTELINVSNVKSLFNAINTISNTSPIEQKKSARELRNAGYSIHDLKTAGYYDAEILGAGYSDYELYSAGYTDVYFQKTCQKCTDNSTTDYIVEYTPIKTMRNTDNMSQKMKQASFIRRTQNSSISQKEVINFRFKNL